MTRQKLFYIAVLLLHLLGGFNSAQNQAFFDNILSETGLSSQKINQIIQDDLGFMWFASQNGLNKYDGYSISVYRNNPADSTSLSYNNLTSIVDDGRFLWIGTMGGGLNRFDRVSKFKSYLHVDGDTTSLADNFIQHIVIDNDSTLWIATRSGLSQFIQETESFKNYFVNKPIYKISEDQNSNLYLSTEDGFYIFNKKSKEYKKIIVGKTNSTSSPIRVLVDSDNFFWIGTNNGLKTFDPKTDEIKDLDQELEKDSKINRVQIEDLFEDSNNAIWIGTFRAGLFKYDKKSKELTRYLKNNYDKNSLGHNSIINIYEDRSHNI